MKALYFQKPILTSHSADKDIEYQITRYHKTSTPIFCICLHIVTKQFSCCAFSSEAEVRGSNPLGCAISLPMKPCCNPLETSSSYCFAFWRANQMGNHFQLLKRLSQIKKGKNYQGQTNGKGITDASFFCHQPQ